MIVQPSLDAAVNTREYGIYFFVFFSSQDSKPVGHRSLSDWILTRKKQVIVKWEQPGKDGLKQSFFA